MKTIFLEKKHIEQGAKMVDFAGFNMPLQYKSSIKEHNAVRENVGLFDVSHMGQFIIKGKHSAQLISCLTCNNPLTLTENKAQYSALINPNGGIIDDILVYKIDNTTFMLVVNASNISKDFDWINKNNNSKFVNNYISINQNYDCSVENISEKTTLLAIQGKNSKELLSKVLNYDNLNKIPYYSFVVLEHNKYGKIIVSYTGYTGEKGFEVYIKNEFAEAFFDNLIFEGKNFDLQLCGLSARDSLRLEKGYCLYGNDIDDQTTPLEAGLGWITKLKDRSFVGSEILLKQKKEGIAKKLIPIVTKSRFIPRRGDEIFYQDKKIGVVKSGGYSPKLKYGIALAIVEKNYIAKEKLILKNNKKETEVFITKLPFCMKPLVKVCLSPALYNLYDTNGFIVVVADVLRATTAICTAFAHGAKKIYTFKNLHELKKLNNSTDFLLAAERNGEVVNGFKRGNSPFDYMENVKDKTIAITTTNGTTAIDKAKNAEEVIIGSLVNFSSVIDYVVSTNKNIMVLCSGWKNRVNIDDTYFAGAVVNKLKTKKFELATDSDSALLAEAVYKNYHNNIQEMFEMASHTKRLKNLNLRKDVEFCFNKDLYNVLPVYNKKGFFEKIKSNVLK